MSSKSKFAFFLLVAVVGLLVLTAGTCGEGTGAGDTWDSIVEGEKKNWGEVGDSLKVDPKVNVWGGETAKAVCVATGGQWSAAIGACKH